MRTLYPEIEPYDTALQVDDRHVLYYEQCGNPKGKPVVLLHGAGRRLQPKMRRFHDPSKYRIVLFDQRGAGRSTPHADLVDNTVGPVADIEKAARTAGIEQLAGVRRLVGLDTGAGVCAGHALRVTELVLRGIFMLRRWGAVVLPGRRIAACSRRRGALRRGDPGGRTRRFRSRRSTSG